jgi:O-antigen ligase
MWLPIGYAVVCIGLILTLTRMTIVVATLQLLLFLFLKRKPEWGVAILGVFAIVLVASLVALPGFASFVLQTLSGQEPSTAGHMSDWSNGLMAFAERPWGYGLGTADAVSTRLGLEHITGDNLYLSYAVQLGLFGLVFLVFVIGAIIAKSFVLLRRATNVAEWRLGMTIFLATIGLALNGMTAVVFNSVMFGWLFFWLAGAAVTLSQRAERAQAEPELRQLNVIQ